jgi:hypothetical protein
MPRRVVAEQLEIESKSWKPSIIFEFQALEPGSFNIGVSTFQLDRQCLTVRAEQPLRDVRHAGLHRELAAQVEFVSKFESSFSCSSFKRLDLGAFNMIFIGSTCTALR